MDISIIVPCYNEKRVIKKNISSVYNYFKKNKTIKNFEIIIVDDGSTDNSYDIVRKLKRGKREIIQNEKRENLGKGYSVNQGVFMARFPYIIFFDADLATPLEETKNFLEYKNFDIVIGTRKNHKAKRTLIRKISGRIFSFFSNLILPLNVSDPQCGIKMFKKDIARKIFGKKIIDHFAFDSEILYIGRKLGFKIKEIPVKWKENDNSKVSLIKDGFNMLVDLIKVRFHDYGFA
ncbi:MAG: glycosyltransferase [Candidatus Pacearchaeota archaeon]